MQKLYCYVDETGQDTKGKLFLVSVIITEPQRDANNIFYSKYHNTRAYVDLTILTTAKSLLNKAQEPYEATIFVDGLKRKERHRFAAGLRKLKVKVRKVRGIREQSDEFIRLADAIAGFIRDSLDGNQAIKLLYKRAEQNKIIREV